MQRGIVIVDDDDLTRRGMAQVFADEPSTDVIAELSHEEALSWTDQWDRADIVIVDAANERSGPDQFPGVGVVQRVRERRTADQTMVIVVTGHFFDDAVRMRMREAGANFLFHRSELHDSSILVDAVLHPDTARSVPRPTDGETIFHLGITAATNVNTALAWAAGEGLLGERQQPRSRRSSMALRRQFNEVANLEPVNADGFKPANGQEAPSLRQIDRFLEWATKIKNVAITDTNDGAGKVAGAGGTQRGRSRR